MGAVGAATKVAAKKAVPKAAPTKVTPPKTSGGSTGTPVPPPASTKRTPKKAPFTPPSRTPEVREARQIPSVSLPKSMNSGVSTGAGFVLGLLFWTWVGLPFLQNGAAGVKNQLKAKFTNKAPDGSWLP